MFNTMQQRLIAMVNDQSYFLAAVSHDLRTPLTRMRLRVETLADEQQRERLKQNIAQMDLMISQVLDYLGTAEQQPAQVVVSLDRDRRGVTIRVKDLGPGMPESIIEAFMDVPLRKKPSNPTSGSYGLGLSIAKRIAVIHNGSLTLRNLTDEGLVAEVFLPLKD